jgi:hypothetical protein
MALAGAGLLTGDTPAGEPGPPPGYQAAPALAAEGERLRAAWIDARDPSGEALYGTLLPEALPDTAARPWAAGAGGIGDPALGGGEDWSLVVWTSWVQGAATLLGMEVQGEGATGPPRVLSAGSPRRPAVAVRGEVAVVIWEHEAAGPGIVAARWVRGEGPMAPAVVSPAAEARWPRIAAGAAGFLAVWSEGPAGDPGLVRALRLDAAGCPAAPALALSGAGARAEYADAAGAAGRWLVAWEETRDGETRLAGRVLDAGGNVLAPLDGPAGEGRPTWVRLAPADTGFALVWLDLTPAGRSLRRCFVDPRGGAHPPAGISLTAPEEFASDPALAQAGGRLTLAWRLPRPQDDDDLLAVRWTALDTASVPASSWLTAVAGAPLGVESASQRLVLVATPNPFRGGVEVRDALGGGTLLVLDAQGRRVRLLPEAFPGRWIWDGRGERGERVPAGVYLARRPGSREALRLVRLP